MVAEYPQIFPMVAEYPKMISIVAEYPCGVDTQLLLSQAFYSQVYWSKVLTIIILFTMLG